MKIPTEMRESDLTEWVGELLLLGLVVDVFLALVVDVAKGLEVDLVIGWVVHVVLGRLVDVVWGWAVDVVGSSTYILNDLMTLYPLTTSPAT